MRQLDVLFEDNHLLVVNKPTGLATMGAVAGADSLVLQAKRYLRQKYNKPGNVYLGVVSRLDAPVTGAVVLARTSKAAARLTAMFQKRSVEKTYWAIVAPARLDSHGSLEHWLIKNEPQRKMETCRPDRDGARKAQLEYHVRSQQKQQACLEVQLLTGRKHQIRVQFAAVGCPIVGDARYGSRIGFADGIALHARKIRFEHPVRKHEIEIYAPLPTYWPFKSVAFSAE